MAPLNKFTFRYNTLSVTEETTLYEFYRARYGAWEAFAFFDFVSRNWTGVSLGAGDGTTTVFNLTAQTTSGRAVYVAGVAKTEGTDYTFSAATGTDGQDRITFATAPANGAAVTADYAGQKYYGNCIFQDDNLDRTLFQHNLYRAGLVLLEVSA